VCVCVCVCVCVSARGEARHALCGMCAGEWGEGARWDELTQTDETHTKTNLNTPIQCAPPNSPFMHSITRPPPPFPPLSLTLPHPTNTTNTSKHLPHTHTPNKPNQHQQAHTARTAANGVGDGGDVGLEAGEGEVEGEEDGGDQVVDFLAHVQGEFAVARHDHPHEEGAEDGVHLCLVVRVCVCFVGEGVCVWVGG
jgi:hypothetical protein